MGDDRIKDLDTIKSIFDKYGVRVLLVYGALLGFYRDKKFLPDDDDIDLAVIDPIDLKTRKAIGWDLYYLGFGPQNISFNVPNASSRGFEMEPSEVGYNGDDKSGIIVCQRNTKFTIFFFVEEPCQKHGRELVCIPKLGAVRLISSPAQFYQKLDTIKVGKTKWLCPAPIRDYLSFTYFNNWKDKTDRRHGETYVEMHLKESIDITGKNEATIYK